MFDVCRSFREKNCLCSQKDKLKKIKLKPETERHAFTADIYVIFFSVYVEIMAVSCKVAKDSVLKAVPHITSSELVELGSSVQDSSSQ